MEVITITISITDDGKAYALINKLINQKAKVEIGFFPESTYSKNGKTAFVAENAMWQEFGTVDDNGKKIIPPRPFLLPTQKENLTKWLEIIKKEIIKQKENINLKKALDVCGFVAQNDVREKIDWWAAQGIPRNAESTIKKKGFDSPLIQDGHMRESVAFETTT